MTGETEPQSTSRPYPPASTLISVLHRMRSRNLPDRVDPEYLKDAGVPDSLNSRTLFAFRFLGLIDGERPTEQLRTIGTGTDEEYRSTLATLLRDSYREVFAVMDPAQDTQDRIIDFFRRYTPGSQRARMVNFLLGMCAEAAIPTLDAPKSRSINAASPKQSGLGKTVRPASRPPTRKAEQEPLVTANPPTSVAPALDLLIRSLPPVGTPMSGAKREQWLNMAKATLAFVYPDEVTAAPEGPREEVKMG